MFTVHFFTARCHLSDRGFLKHSYSALVPRCHLLRTGRLFISPYAGVFFIYTVSEKHCLAGYLAVWSCRGKFSRQKLVVTQWSSNEERIPWLPSEIALSPDLAVLHTLALSSSALILRTALSLCGHYLCAIWPLLSIVPISTLSLCTFLNCKVAYGICIILLFTKPNVYTCLYTS